MKLTATKSGIRVIPKAKRESFLPSDKVWLETNPKIEADKFVNSGTRGSVYTIKGNSNLVVKVPRGFEYVKSGDVLEEKQARARDDIEDEITTIDKMAKHELIIPSKAVTIKNKAGFDIPGIIRPKVKIIADPTNPKPSGLKDLTDTEIEQLRQKIISLSEKGILIRDGLQVGRDRKGRIQLYDVGGIEKYSNKFEGPEYVRQYAFHYNQNEWRFFLQQVGVIRYCGSRRCSADTAFKKYGRIEPRNSDD